VGVVLEVHDRRPAEAGQRGRASVISLALALLDHLGDLPPACLPAPT
jgi:hypothetical protein